MKKNVSILFGVGALALLAACSTVAALTFVASLDPVAGAPANATGDATVVNTDGAVVVTGDYSGLSGAATAAHIHLRPAAGQDGPPIVDLTATEGAAAGSGTLSGTATVGTGTGSISGQQQTIPSGALEDGLLYVVVHTAANPGGEIRGDLAAE